MLDLVLEGGDLIDGTGAPARRADVGLAGDRIAAIGDLRGAARARTVPCAGQVVAPGFIDIHSHSDVSCVLHPQGRSSLLQGITTEVVGNCGYSLGPLGPDSRAALFDRLLGRCLGPGTADLVDWSWRSLPDFMEARRATRHRHQQGVPDRWRNLCGPLSSDGARRPPRPRRSPACGRTSRRRWRRGRSDSPPGSSTAPALMRGSPRSSNSPACSRASTRSTSRTCATRATGSP